MSLQHNLNLIAEAKAAIDAGKCSEAASILAPIAESDDAEAQFLLGYLYFTECDVPRAKAYEWLVKARGQGHAGASYWLSWFPNADGISVCGQTQESADLLIEAGERGFIEAQRELGALYATGDWIGGKDEAEAVNWYTKAAECGHT